MNPTQREILQKVERGELSPSEAAELLSGAPSAPSAPPAPPPPAAQAAPFLANLPIRVESGPSAPPRDPEAELDDIDTRLAGWKRWWMIPLWAGMGVFLLGAALMAWGYTAGRMFWFYCSFLPLLMGLGVMGLAWWSQRARWLHVRVEDPDEKTGKTTRVSVSMPLPIHFAGWVLRTFGNRIPGLRDQPQVISSMPEMLAELDQNKEPLIVEVDETDGTHVRVYIV